MTEKDEPASKRPRIAVVGCGNIGSRHLAIIESLPEAILAGFCDTDPEKLSKFSDLYPGVPAFSSIQELLEGCPAEIVNVCTPHFLHCEHALAVIESGRHVLVEKPMCLNTRDADRMIQAAGKGGVLLMVVKQNRYNLPVAVCYFLDRRALNTSGRWPHGNHDHGNSDAPLFCVR